MTSETETDEGWLGWFWRILTEDWYDRLFVAPRFRRRFRK
jgi:hypothetical protein